MRRSLMGLLVCGVCMVFFKDYVLAYVTKGASCFKIGAKDCGSYTSRCTCQAPIDDGYWYCSDCASGYVCSSGSCVVAPTPIPTRCVCGSIYPYKECTKGSVYNLQFGGAGFTWECRPDNTCQTAVSCTQYGNFEHTCEAIGKLCENDVAVCGSYGGVASLDYIDNYTCKLIGGNDSFCCVRSYGWDECYGYNSQGFSDCDMRNGGVCNTCKTVSTNLGERILCNPGGDIENTEEEDVVDGKNEFYNGSNGACTTYPGGVCSSLDITDKCTSSETNSSTITGTGPYTWTCNGTGGGVCGGIDGVNANCSATKITPINGVCGSPAASCTGPTSGLCTDGSPSAISSNTTNFWWTCSAGNLCGVASGTCYSAKTTINGDCGAADGTCDAGQVVDAGSTSVRVDGIYSLWNCNSTCNGTNASCEYKICSRVNGVCGSTDGTCSAGNVYDVGTTLIKADGIYSLWSCNGTCNGTNASCKFKTCNRVDGLCGTADGGNYATAPTSGLCGSGTASPVPPTDLGTSYSWSCLGSCSGSNDSCLATHDIAPNLTSAVLKNAGGTVIAAEVGGINHSCDVNFGSNKTNIWTITASDANGLADIKETYIRFRSVANTYSYGPVTTVNGVASFTIDTTSIITGTYQIEVLINDVHTPPGNRDWIATGRSFKVWDCLVDVTGTIYDSSGETFVCSNSSNVGFTKTIPSGISFGMDYRNATETKTMTVTSPNFSSGSNDLIWQNTYGVAFGIDFPGILNASKIGDTCLPAWNSQFSLRNYVNPYSANPAIGIKYSSVLDQEAWFRANSGSVIAETRVTNLVPITCTGDDCKTASGGVVWSKIVDLSDYDEAVGITAQPQPPKRNYYKTLKSDIFGRKGIGTTYTTSVKWSDIKNTASGIIFVEGNLTIDENMAPANYVFAIVSGGIDISQGVSSITKTMLYAEAQIVAGGTSANKLAISGTLYGKAGVILNRSYTDKGDNNDAPAVEVTYDPGLIFKLPNSLWVKLENWRLE